MAGIFDCKGKLVLVTGASSGIGAGVAMEFARRGAALALVGRDEGRLEEVRSKITAGGSVAKSFLFDLVHLSEMSNLVRDIEAQFQQNIGILINAAGIGILGFVEDVPVEEYQRILTINFLAPLALIKSVLPGMKNNGGQIINITSGVGDKGIPGASPYCVSKFALNALTESLFLEAGGEHIDVISISPGLVQTSFSGKMAVHGHLKEDFTKGPALAVDFVARKIAEASYHRKTKVVLSLRTKVAAHLNYWCPALLNRVLIHWTKRDR